MIASVGAHGVLVWLAPSSVEDSLAEAAAIVPVTLEWIEPVDPVPTPAVVERETERAPDPVGAVRGSLRRRPLRRAQEPASGPPQTSSVELVESEVETAEVEPGGETPAPGPPSRLDIERMLDPEGVARRSYRATGPGPSRRGPPAGLADTGPGPLSEAEAEARHQTFLRGRAMDRPWLTRTEPELVRRSDGTYAYEGHAFTAIVHRDGHVTYEARSDIGLDDFGLQNGRIDIDNMIHDVYRAEREWFLRRTEPQRARIEAEYRRETREEALRVLPGHLAGIWRRRARRASLRRRAIFRLWDEMADDEGGRRGRAIVLGWIRENLPAGGADAYPEVELDRLNASRESTARFQPY